MRLPPGGGSSAGVGGVGDAVLVGRSALPCPPLVTRHAPPVTLHAPHRDRRSAADRHRLEAHSGPRLACWRQASDNHARKCLCHMGLRAHLSRRSGSPQARRCIGMTQHPCRIVNAQHTRSHAATSRLLPPPIPPFRARAAPAPPAARPRCRRAARRPLPAARGQLVPAGEGPTQPNLA